LIFSNHRFWYSKYIRLKIWHCQSQPPMSIECWNTPSCVPTRVPSLSPSSSPLPRVMQNIKVWITACRDEGPFVLMMLVGWIFHLDVAFVEIQMAKFCIHVMENVRVKLKSTNHHYTSYLLLGCNLLFDFFFMFSSWKLGELQNARRRKLN
jgi:hypothetical protein